MIAVALRACKLGTPTPPLRSSHSPEVEKLGGVGQYLSAYLLGICVPHCPIIWNALIRTFCPSPAPGLQRSVTPITKDLGYLITKDLGYSGADLPFWTPSPSPRGARYSPFWYAWALTFTTVSAALHLA